ncbi:MAG: alpha/beta fold hydrolase [Pseudomonadota bacterium]
MIAHLTRFLLLVQLAVATLCALGFRHLWPDISWLFALLLGTMCVLFARAVITANNFRLAAGVPCTAGPAVLNIGAALRLYSSELRATLLSSSWTMPFRRPGIFLAAEPTTLPVLLIHGYGCNGGYWWYLSKRLKAANITHFAVDLEPVLCGIDTYLPQITTAIETLQAATRQRQIVIVAHSMGGLVARAWLRDHPIDCIAKLITLGTPHSGTALARFGPGENSRQMLPPTDTGGAPWLTQLNAASGRAVPTVSIYSLHDNIIAPRSSSFLPGAKNIALAGIGHVALGSHPAVISIVIEEVRNAATDGQTPLPSESNGSDLDPAKAVLLASDGDSGA